MDLFYLASYDLDNFRVFVASPFFHDVYDLEPALFQKLLTDEVELMKFAARYLKQVLFGEKTIPEKPDAVEKRMKRRQEINEKRKQEAPKTLAPEYDRPDEGERIASPRSNSSKQKGRVLPPFLVRGKGS